MSPVLTIIVELLVDNVIDCNFLVLRNERQAASQNRISDNTHAPDICLVVVEIFIDELRGAIGEGSAYFPGLFCWREDDREAKVDDLWDDLSVIMLFNHDVFKLQVSMYYTNIMHEL